jgi:hypothetical protein
MSTCLSISAWKALRYKMGTLFKARRARQRPLAAFLGALRRLLQPIPLPRFEAGNRGPEIAQQPERDCLQQSQHTKNYSFRHPA